MTVQTKVDDGTGIKTRTWRDIYKTKGLAELREGFYAQREHCRWGVMIQLKGKERILLGSFGDLDLALRNIGGDSIVLPNVKVPDDRIFCKFCEYYCSGQTEMAEHIKDKHNATL